MQKFPGKNRNILIFALTVLAGAAIVISESTGLEPRSGQKLSGDVSDFYERAPVRLLVPNNPGGGYDAYARLLAPFLARNLGTQVRVQNLPGAGGIRCLAELYRSPRDGRTIALLNGAGMANSYIAGLLKPGLDIRSLSYIGRVVYEPRVLLLRDDSAVNTFGKLLSAEEPIIYGATGFGGSMYLNAVITAEMFGSDVQVVRGFHNSAQVQRALLQGKLTGAWTSLSSSRLLGPGQLRLAAQGDTSRHPRLPDVPSVSEFLQLAPDPARARSLLESGTAMHRLGRVLAAPPGIPAARLEFLRNALRDALQDPSLQEQMAQSGRPLDYASGRDMEKWVVSATVLPDDLRRAFVNASRSQR